MIGLLKAFGKGLLYVVGLPFFLLALLLFAAIGLLLFIFQIIRSVIYFFTGQRFFPELPEDKELRLRKEAAENGTRVIDQQVDNSQDIIVPLIEERPAVSEPSQNSYSSVEEACFKETKEEPVEEPEIVIQPLTREEPIEEEETFDDFKEETLKTQEAEEIIIKDEDLEEYIPKVSPIEEDIEEEDTGNGVDIINL